MSNAAYASIVKDHEGRIRAVAKTVVRPGVEIDDLVQEGRIALLRALERFDPSRGASLWTYARRLVKSSMRDYVEKERKHFDGRVDECDEGDAFEGVDETTPEDGLLTAEAKRQLVIAVMSLSDDEREILVMHFDEDQSYRAIAPQLKISIGSVHNAIKAALESLKAKAA